jgi:ankyrin repeat protein
VVLTAAPRQLRVMALDSSFEDGFRIEELHFAAQDGDLAEVTRLLNEGNSPNVFDELGKTPLHYAAAHGHLDILRLLLASGAGVNAHDQRVIGDTVLRGVASNCSFDVAKILVDAGANPTIPGWMVLTALDQSKDRKKPEGVRVHQLLLQTAKRFRPAKYDNLLDGVS